MIAAIYARKSTEQSDDASVERQEELARAFAATKGWQVVDAHVYIDRVISGAECLKRPAYRRLMAALDPAPPFGALIVMEQSRLGRDTGRVLLAIQALEEAGVTRVIDDAEAAIVRRLFAECAQGRGFTRIAKRLTAEGVPSPHPGRGWAATAVREMIFRPLYRGQIVYGKTRWQTKGGTKRKVRVPEAEWIRVAAPALAIVTEAEWQAAHRRLDRTRAIYLRRTKGKLWGRPEAGLEAKYLLSGFVVCGVCGGAMHATKRTSLRGAPQLYYVCRTHRVRGDLLCANAMSAPMTPLDTDVLTTFERDVLTADVIDAVVRRAVEIEHAHPDDLAGQRESLQHRLRQTEAELGRFTDAIRQFGPLARLGEELRALERRRGELQAQLEHLDGLAKAATAWMPPPWPRSSRRCWASGRPCSAGSRCRRGRSCGS